MLALQVVLHIQGIGLPARLRESLWHHLLGYTSLCLFLIFLRDKEGNISMMVICDAGDDMRYDS